MIETVEFDGVRYALIVRSDFREEGVHFITNKENPLQLGILGHQQGTYIKPHVHNTFRRPIDSVQEVVHVECGMVEVTFYDHQRNTIDKRILKAGDTVLLMTGGHGFRILQDSKMLEVKQGPYFGPDEDKERWDS